MRRKLKKLIEKNELAREMRALSDYEISQAYLRGKYLSARPPQATKIEKKRRRARYFVSQYDRLALAHLRSML